MHYIQITYIIYITYITYKLHTLYTPPIFTSNLSFKWSSLW